MSHAWLAALLAVWCAQVLPGIKPPAAILQPPVLVVALLCYGGGGLLARETAVRRDGPVWPPMVRLAAGYALWLYGIVLRDAQSGEWNRLGPLADTQHGHLLGLNWTWTLLAVDFYVLMAVVVPVTAVELLRPAARGVRWLSDGWFRLLRGVLGAVLVLGLLAPERGPLVVFWALFAVGLWLVRGARGWRPRPVKPLRAWRPWRVGASLAALTLLPLAAMSQLTTAPPRPTNIPAAWSLFGWLLAGTLVVMRHAARRVAGGWTDRHRWALLTGSVSVWIVLALGQEHDQYHLAHASGLGLAGVLTAVWLVWARRRLILREELT